MRVGKERAMGVSAIKVCVIAIWLFAAVCAANEAHHQHFSEEFGQPEVIEMTMDEFKERFNTTAYTREDQYRMIASCWEENLIKCIRECKERNHTAEVFFEVCVSYCQADVMWNCTALNFQNGGNAKFKFGFRWPLERVSLFIQPASALFSFLAFLIQLLALGRYISQTKGRQTANAEFVDYWKLSLFLWAATFFTATLYYTVDIRLTEYALFILLTASSLLCSFISLIRLFALHRWSTQLLFATPFLGFLFFYIIYLTHESFSLDVAYAVIDAAAVIQGVCWGVWWVRERRRYPHANCILLPQILLAIGSYLRASYNFPPYFDVVDVYSLYMFTLLLVSSATSHFAIFDTLSFPSPVVGEKKLN